MSPPAGQRLSDHRLAADPGCTRAAPGRRYRSRAARPVRRGRSPSCPATSPSTSSCSPWKGTRWQRPPSGTWPTPAAAPSWRRRETGHEPPPAAPRHRRVRAVVPGRHLLRLRRHHSAAHHQQDRGAGAARGESRLELEGQIAQREQALYEIRGRIRELAARSPMRKGSSRTTCWRVAALERELTDILGRYATTVGPSGRGPGSHPAARRRQAEPDRRDAAPARRGLSPQDRLGGRHRRRQRVHHLRHRHLRQHVQRRLGRRCCARSRRPWPSTRRSKAFR
jgi:hypothetical protein